jgi:hypothetical protein
MAQGENSNYSWQAAFVAFCNGVPAEEIGQVYAIPAETLKQRMARENWNMLRGKMPLATLSDNPLALAQRSPGLPAELEAKFKLIEENRLENLKVFTTLRDDLIEILAKLRKGDLKLEKQFHNRGSVVRADVDPGIVDRVNLATYAQTIANGTYRALGDFQGQEKVGQDAAAGTAAPSGPAITIILPGVVAVPRNQRGADNAKAAQVIDLTPLG